MKFKIGDRVKRNNYLNQGDNDAHAVHTGDLGTVFGIIWDDFYQVTWDVPRRLFYSQDEYLNTWNIYGKYIELAGPPKTKEEQVIDKIQELNKRYADSRTVSA